MDMASDFLVSKRPGYEPAKLSRVTFISPGGNDTAIVWDQMNRKLYGIVSKYIQEAYGNIEQVMFAEKDPKTGMYRGQMAGGEYCGNATRSFGYMLLGGQNGKIEFEVSGTKDKQTVIVSDGCAATTIPLADRSGWYKSGNEVSVSGTGEYMVEMDGIAHLVSYEFQKCFNAVNAKQDLESKKRVVYEILSQLALSNFPAVGAMLVSRDLEGGFSLVPYVYVTGTQTLYREGACGSGTAAVAMVESFRRKQSIPALKILQPSGMVIEAAVDYTNKKFENVRINGEVKVLYDGGISIRSLSISQITDEMEAPYYAFGRKPDFL